MRLTFLRKLAPKMLQSCISALGIEGLFAHSLSTDTIKRDKPDPRTYQPGRGCFRVTFGEYSVRTNRRMFLALTV
jgi:hypothetical protein